MIKNSNRLFTLICLSLCVSPLWAAEEISSSGRFSLYSSLSIADEGDIGFASEQQRHTSHDSQTLRLMFDQRLNSHHSWVAHLISAKYQTNTPAVENAPELFRVDSLKATTLEEKSADSQAIWYHQPDHLYYQFEKGSWRYTLGRQPISWGAGRFWQPADLFGAFSPIALDREYKRGIDGVVMDYFPSHFSSLTVAYIFSEANQDLFTDSWGFYYKQQVGEISELAVVGGNVLGTEIAGGSFESAVGDVGWRWEGILYRLESNREVVEQFWVLGLDYQLIDNSFFSLEYYHNSGGAGEQQQLATTVLSTPYHLGLQKHLSQSLLGMGLQYQVTPLISAGYSLLAAYVDSDKGGVESYLHQLSLIYSVSDEADALLAVMKGSGPGLNNSLPESEFGALPDTLTLRVQFYF